MLTSHSLENLIEQADAGSDSARAQILTLLEEEISGIAHEGENDDEE